jgi:ligand-binding sensor domain-containing protein
MRQSRLSLRSGCQRARGKSWPLIDDGLPDNKIRTVLEHRDGNIWIGTWSGLSVIVRRMKLDSQYVLIWVILSTTKYEREEQFDRVGN